MASQLPPPQHPYAKARLAQNGNIGRLRPRATSTAERPLTASGFPAVRVPDISIESPPSEEQTPANDAGSAVGSRRSSLQAPRQTRHVRSSSAPSLADGLRAASSIAAAHTETGSMFPLPVLPPSPPPSIRSKAGEDYFSKRRGSHQRSVSSDHVRHRLDFDDGLEQLKALELEEFLERASKSMDEVNFDDTTSRLHEYPQLDKYRSVKTGSTDYVGYAESWLSAWADHHLPKDMITCQNKTKWTLSRSRASVERLYVLCPPELLQYLLLGKIAGIYRWDNPLKTGSLAVLYLALWWYDQILAAAYVYAAYRICCPYLYPPSASEIRKRLAKRKARSREAKDLGSDFESSIKSSQLSQSVMASASIAALVGAGAALQPQAVTADHPPMHHRPEVEALLKLPAHIGPRGAYRLTREVLERFGPVLHLAMDDLADYLEKLKNLVVWRRPSATKQSLAIILAVSLVLSIMPPWLQYKMFFLWVWAQFFIIWPLQDHYPRYRRALNPAWYLLWNVPNDADSAVEILQQRALNHRRTSESPRASTDSLVVKPEVPLRRKSMDFFIHSNPPSPALSVHITEPMIARHFALHRGIPGYLILSHEHIYFEPSKGFRTITAKVLSRKPVQPHTEHVTPVIFKEPLGTVMSVKKESRFDIGIFDTDGLLIALSGSRIIRLASVHKRDEAFAHLLSHCTRGKRE